MKYDVTIKSFEFSNIKLFCFHIYIGLFVI